jgi:hypothetical protein
MKLSKFKELNVGDKVKCESENCNGFVIGTITAFGPDRIRIKPIFDCIYGDQVITRRQIICKIVKKKNSELEKLGHMYVSEYENHDGRKDTSFLYKEADLLKNYYPDGTVYEIFGRRVK